jgi:hypothetical protein
MSEAFAVGSLYLAAFAQAGAPHAGLIIPIDHSRGDYVHIRMGRESLVWELDADRSQRLEGSLTLTSLLRIRDVAKGAITKAELKDAAQSVEVPPGAEFGECLPWALKVIEVLQEKGLLNLTSSASLAEEFNQFASGNKSHARRDMFPAIKVSEYCS